MSIDTSELVDICREFIKKNNIHCAETIYQTDRVIEQSYFLIEEICEVVGYLECEADDE
jgi:hypothetical protein